jgi:hypothetical protein
MYSAPFTQLNTDSYAPIIPKLSLQQWDNYSIYSLACINTNNLKITTTYNYQKSLGRFTVVKGKFFLMSPSTTVSSSTEVEAKLSKFIAYQAHHLRSIPVDFRQYIETYHQTENSTKTLITYAQITKN